MTTQRPLSTIEQIAFDTRLKVERQHQPHGYDCRDFEYETAVQIAVAVEKAVRKQIADDIRDMPDAVVADLVMRTDDSRKFGKVAAIIKATRESAARIAEEGTQT